MENSQHDLLPVDQVARKIHDDLQSILRQHGGKLGVAAPAAAKAPNLDAGTQQQPQSQSPKAPVK